MNALSRIVLSTPVKLQLFNCHAIWLCWPMYNNNKSIPVSECSLFYHHYQMAQEIGIVPEEEGYTNPFRVTESQPVKVG